MFDNIYKDKKVIITGDTGFKGSWLAIWLLSMGADVVGISLPPQNSRDNYVVCGLSERLTHIDQDIRDYDALCKIFDEYNPEIVFHLAAQAIVLEGYQDPLNTFSTNFMGTVNVLEAIRHTESVKAGVIITTDKCYENREWVYGYRETDRLGGNDPYSASKAACEMAVASYTHSFFNDDNSANIASARAGNVIGGGDWAENRIVPDCVRALEKDASIIIRNPNAVRPWQHVLEPLSGYLLLAKRLYEKGSPYVGAWNFGPFDEDSKPVEWLVRRICERWGDSAGYEVVHGNQPHEAHYLKLDCSKAGAVLGWHPCWRLETAIDKAMEWYEANRSEKNSESLRNICFHQIEEYSALRSKR